MTRKKIEVQSGSVAAQSINGLATNHIKSPANGRAKYAN
jgi:hypothetical protein